MEIFNLIGGDEPTQEAKHSSKKFSYPHIFSQKKKEPSKVRSVQSGMYDTAYSPLLNFTLSNDSMSILNNTAAPQKRKLFSKSKVKAQAISIEPMGLSFEKNTTTRKPIPYIDSVFLQKIATTVLAVAAFVSVLFTAYKYLDNAMEYRISTRDEKSATLAPPRLDKAHEIDSSKLNSAMADFAIEESTAYNEEGFLTDSTTPRDISQVFSQPIKMTTYTIEEGDTIASITKKCGLSNISTLIAVNDIDNVRSVRSGQKLQVPSMDGLYYTIEEGNTLEGLAVKFNVSVEEIVDVNELETQELAAGARLFMPGATLDKATLQNALGAAFRCPLSTYRLTSHFGNRLDPITGVKSSHTGIDMAISSGTPIMASASGTVSTAGFSNIFGNYVIINHAQGYQTLYGHMSKIHAKKGQWVSQGTVIGLVGSTGYSTGPHLHFTVYKNGRLIDPLSVIGK